MTAPEPVSPGLTDGEGVGERSRSMGRILARDATFAAPEPVTEVWPSAEPAVDAANQGGGGAGREPLEPPEPTGLGSHHDIPPVSLDGG